MLKERFSRFKAAKKFEDKNWVMGSCLTLIKFPIITLIYLFFLPFEFLCFYSSFLCFFGFFLLLANKTVFNDLSKFLSAIPLSYLFFSNFLSLFLSVFLSVYVSDSQPAVCEEPEGVHKMPNFSLGVRDHQKVANRWSICIWEFVCLWLCLPILYSFYEKMLVGFFIFSSLSSITQLQKSRAKQFSFFKYDFIFPSICFVTISCEQQKPWNFFSRNKDHLHLHNWYLYAHRVEFKISEMDYWMQNALSD